MSPPGCTAPRPADGWRLDRAAASDLPALHRLSSLAGAVSWSAEALSDELSRADSTTWTARGPEGPVGLLVAREVAGELHVLNVAVDPALRRQGLGRRLLDAALAEARGRRLSAALLELRATNEAALQLYRRAGFVVVGRRPRYYPGGEDALLMALPLDSGQAPAPSREEEPSTGAGSGVRGPRGETPD